jgi:hypothetical protein
MPDYKAHTKIGIAVWLVFLVWLLQRNAADPKATAFAGLTGFCFCFLGSILPDIDEKHSEVFRHTRFIIGAVTFTSVFAVIAAGIPQKTLESAAYVFGVSALLTAAVLLFFYAIIPRHRGPVHSMKTGLVYSAAALGLSFLLLNSKTMALSIALFAFLAFFSHLVLDRCVK